MVIRPARIPAHVARLRRVLWLLCLLAAIWAAVVTLTGGFAFHLGGLRLASRSSRSSIIVCLVSAVAAWALATPGPRLRVLGADCACMVRAIATLFKRAQSLLIPNSQFLIPRSLPVTAAAASVAVVALGLLKGSFVAGGSDSYGYVSQAHLWATGSVRIEQPFMRDLTWPYAFQSLAPLGYRPAPQGTSIVPIYAPGLPMLMAVFERLGGRDAVFLVVPLLGGLAVWATYLMGAHLADQAVGLSAAILLATSPAFLNQLINPMSDVPVTAWWALTLALVLVDRRDAAFAAGLAAGAAILTRPNLVVLAVFPSVLLLRQAVRERSVVAFAAGRALLFAAGVIPSCFVVAILNTLWYGSPMASGYGALSDLYRWDNLRTNLARYSAWLFETETPMVLLAAAAPLLVTARYNRNEPKADTRRVTIVWLCFIVAVLGCYLFYIPFDSVWYLRFLLPAFPPLLVLTSVAIIAIGSRLMRGAREIATAAVILLLAWHNLHYVLDRGVFGFRDTERKYVAVGDYIARRLPERAVLFSMQHSGSARYYSGRLTVRYDLIPSTRLDWAINELRGLGYRPYFLLEQWEEETFRARFKNYSPLAALDWPPVARLEDSSDVKIYDPADREATGIRRQPVTDVIY